MAELIIPEAARVVIGKLAHGLYGALLFGLVMLAGLLFAVLVRRMVRQTLGLSQLPRGLVDLAAKSAYYFIVSLAAIVGLALAGVDVTGFAFAGSLFGVALGFAAQTVASNFFSGFFLYIDKPLQPGEYVELKSAGILGKVLDITMFSTRIETLDGRIVRIPNEDIFKDTIVNLHRSVARRIDYSIGISYSADIDMAKKAIMEVLERHPLVLAEPPPEIHVDELGDNAVVLKVMFWVPSWRWLQMKWQLLGEIKEALDRAGVEIPFPQRVVWLHIEGGGSSESLENALPDTVGGSQRAAEAVG